MPLHGWRTIGRRRRGAQPIVFNVAGALAAAEVVAAEERAAAAAADAAAAVVAEYDALYESYHAAASDEVQRADVAAWHAGQSARADIFRAATARAGPSVHDPKALAAIEEFGDEDAEGAFGDAAEALQNDMYEQDRQRRVARETAEMNVAAMKHAAAAAEAAAAAAAERNRVLPSPAARPPPDLGAILRHVDAESNRAGLGPDLGIGYDTLLHTLDGRFETTDYNTLASFVERMVLTRAIIYQVAPNSHFQESSVIRSIPGAVLELWDINTSPPTQLIPVYPIWGPNRGETFGTQPNNELLSRYIAYGRRKSSVRLSYVLRQILTVVSTVNTIERDQTVVMNWAGNILYHGTKYEVRLPPAYPRTPRTPPEQMGPAYPETPGRRPPNYIPGTPGAAMPEAPTYSPGTEPEYQSPPEESSPYDFRLDQIDARRTHGPPPRLNLDWRFFEPDTGLLFPGAGAGAAAAAPAAAPEPALVFVPGAAAAAAAPAAAAPAAAPAAGGSLGGESRGTWVTEGFGAWADVGEDRDGDLDWS